MINGLYNSLCTIPTLRTALLTTVSVKLKLRSRSSSGKRSRSPSGDCAETSIRSRTSRQVAMEKPMFSEAVLLTCNTVGPCQQEPSPACEASWCSNSHQLRAQVLSVILLVKLKCMASHTEISMEGLGIKEASAAAMNFSSNISLPLTWLWSAWKMAGTPWSNSIPEAMPTKKAMTHMTLMLIIVHGRKDTQSISLYKRMFANVFVWSFSFSGLFSASFGARPRTIAVVGAASSSPSQSLDADLIAPGLVSEGRLSSGWLSGLPRCSRR
mmetsp:Transcript_42299/g.122791  ORF Transcript_42299/g.122791 Transcript_42299/m.122791 type:complete len:269 (-) Transcript_42299:2359-3165(-)